MKFLCAILVLISLAGCNKDTKPAPVYPERLPVTKEMTDLTKVPEYNTPTTEGDVVPIEEGEVSPIDGIVITEDKAFSAAGLRTDYDELYQLHLTDNKVLIHVIRSQEQELFRGDQIIAKKDDELDRLRNSWWQRNKLSIGIASGVVIGAIIVLAGGRVWAEIDDKIDE